MCFKKEFLLIGLISFNFIQLAFAQKLSRSDADNFAQSELAREINLYKLQVGDSWKTNVVLYKDLVMKYDYKIFGKKPETGRSLFISLHGGGNAAPDVNDQQWQNQHFLYTPAEGVYLVPRAPTNTWNLWHEDHIDNMLDSIIKRAVIFLGVNPNKVYIMGYSAGGDGVFQLAPRMADRWAAAAMMAGHPGDASALPLRNLPFTAFVGGADAAYNRNKLVKAWGEKLDSLKMLDTAGYTHSTTVYEGLPHWMNRKDTIALDWMAKFTRNPLPKKINWVQDDRHETDFYWLSTDSVGLKTGNSATVSVKENTINIEHNDYERLFIYLNDKLVNLDKAIKVLYNGKVVFNGKVNRTAKTITETITKRLDPNMVFSAKLEVKNGKVNRL
ncbi:alpha/beta hydrolase family protein [Pedobacter paludis]|uniref:Alpha/beta hydrolase n=1 Tax=Pedobacter paludis TaxID=2203212 RepID=A0A317EX16_9SPHI|nr:alpha/beta hydrolase [Pedobacter paludis]PWS30513.1 alpha/beta hydrolase [Pedobacter paludis]